jgi:hypothetical protein
VNVGSCGNTLKEIEWKNNEKKKKEKTMAKHGINDLIILLLMVKPDHVIVCDM